MTDQHEIETARAKSIYLLPNLFTIGALFAGFYAIVAATKQQFAIASIAIFVAMLLDGLDGRIARLTKTQSEFGAMFDSLSDMVCFGITPALVLYTWTLHWMGKPGWLAAFIFTVCACIRLARFNSKDQGENKRYFQGLSTTAAAGFIASFVWVATKYGWPRHSLALEITIMTVMVGLLEVSVIPYRSFKDLDVRHRVPFVVVLLIVLIFVLISVAPPDVFLTIFSLYVLSGPVGAIFLLFKYWRRRRRKLNLPHQKEKASDDTEK